MNRNVLKASCACLLAAVCVQTADAQTYFARTRMSPLAKSSTSGGAAPTRTCTSSSHGLWTYLSTPGARYGDASVVTKVGSAADRSDQILSICEQATKGTSRTQCQVYGQGGMKVDVYVTKVDGTVPVSVEDRDNAIVFEVVTCS